MKETRKRQAFSEHGEIKRLTGRPFQASRHVHSEMLETDQLQSQSQYIEQ